MVKYPAQIDDTTSLPIALNNIAPPSGLTFNKLREAVMRGDVPGVTKASW